MAKNPIPDQSVLRQLLDYDPETGVLRWKPRTESDFTDAICPSCRCRQWNARNAGREAFTSTTKGSGYNSGTINYVPLLAHRVIWKWWHGSEPLTIDHINGIRTDNRISNLRNVTDAVNGRNRARRKDNTSGHPGVFNDKSRGRWNAYIMDFDGKYKFVGSYGSKKEAIRARRLAEAEYGYHENHGRPPHARQNSSQA